MTEDELPEGFIRWVTPPAYMVKHTRGGGHGLICYKTEEAAKQVVELLNSLLPHEDIAWLGEYHYEKTKGIAVCEDWAVAKSRAKKEQTE